MKTKHTFIQRAALLLLLSTLNPQFSAFAQGTAFTYQGRLADGANSANGSYDLTFALYPTSSGGIATAGPLTNSAVAVSNGLFTVTLDFGASAFTGPVRWLEIGVGTNGGGVFATLAPRQQVTPTPYAIYAESGSASALNGNIRTSNLGGSYNNALTFTNAGNNFGGNGSGLFNVNAASLGGLSASSFWNTAGNAGTAPGANFVGTTDNQPLELKVNGGRALRLEPTATDTNHSGIVNVIAGSPANFVAPGIYGATISGGGAGNYFGPGSNAVTAIFGTVGGGYQNIASGTDSTVAGGTGNNASGISATVGGGNGNTASTNYATVGGGSQNIASGYRATVGGGAENTASGAYATVPGGSGNTAAGYESFAAGSGASANHDASFVWADISSVSPFTTTAANQFLVRAVGGVGIGTNSPAGALHVASASGAPQIQITQNNASDYTRLRMAVAGSPSWEMDVSPGAAPAISWWTGSLRMNLDYNGNLTTTGTVNGSSDRNVKEHFSPVSARDVLEKVSALPVTEWNYKTDGEALRHIGPMAQDFYAAFNVGTDEKHISMVDADGVALAAIQGLNQKLEEQRAENAELKQRLEKLERLMTERSGDMK